MFIALQTPQIQGSEQPPLILLMTRESAGGAVAGPGQACPVSAGGWWLDGSRVVSASLDAGGWLADSRPPGTAVGLFSTASPLKGAYSWDSSMSPVY